MNAMNQFRTITHTFHKSIRTLTAGALALFIGVSASQAVSYNWTNTTGAAFNDPTSWNGVGGPGGAVDTANFAINGTINTYLASNVVNLGSINFGPTAAGQVLNASIDLRGFTFSGLSGGASGSGSGFVSGQQSGGTCHRYLCEWDDLSSPISPAAPAAA